jgi:hypothetical protein
MLRELKEYLDALEENKKNTTKITAITLYRGI